MTQGWTIDASADTITFLESPPAGTDNITVSEFASATINASPLWRLGAWNPAFGYPKEGEFYSDRLWLAATRSQPQTIWSSRVGDYSMFGRSTPIQDDDAINATLNARQLNEIVDLLPKQHLLALTVGGVWKCGGTDTDALTPTSFAVRPQPSSGSSYLPALDVGETAVYYTHKGGQVRDLSFTFEADGYAGSDLTAFASHLIENRSIIDWSWQSVPYSAVYAVRSDGWLLTMTYKREHQVVAWTRHDTEGTIDSVCVIPEDGIYAVYVGVSRRINGDLVRMVERFAAPAGEDWREHVGLDCSLTYDGRRKITAITLAPGVTVDDPVTITTVGTTFSESNLGDAIVVGYDNDPQPLYVTISEVVSSTVAIGYASRPPRSEELTPGEWSLAVDRVSGLDHLEGMTVRLAFDGFDGGEAVVADGVVSLPYPGVLVHVGLGFVSDYESLGMTLIGGEPVGTRKKIVKKVGVLVRNARVLKAGPDFDHLESRKSRQNEPLGAPPNILNGWERYNVTAEWGEEPTICIRCDDPYGVTILGIEPDVEFGK